MQNQILHDSQAVAHLLQQDVSATSTIRNMEYAFNNLRAEHLHADEALRAQDIHTQSVIQVGVAQIQATHDRGRGRPRCFNSSTPHSAAHG
jgi:hypothetical protein